MSRRRFEVVIVGARCAGAALAVYLSRSGARVLVVDQGSPGAPMELETLVVAHVAGKERLRRLLLKAAHVAGAA